jgi:hypothetical protein
VITGDITQIDLPNPRKSGLLDAINVLDGVEGIHFCHFEDGDVVRHALVQRIVRAYESVKPRSRSCRWEWASRSTLGLGWLVRPVTRRSKRRRCMWRSRRIRPEPGSDASVLLIDPKRVLEAKKLPTRVIRSNVLPFEYVILGENQSRTADGSFNEKPAGNWTCVKIFLPPGGDDGELYLNFNPAIQKAEFSEKDSDYGNYLLAKFATVL